MSNTTTTRTVTTLLEILNDEEVSTSRRIEAAEAILAFESPVEGVEAARQYLMSVFEDRDKDIDLRMDALKVARKHESPKTSVGVVRLQDNTDFVEKQRKEAILRRRMILVMKGIEPWDFPEDWDGDLRDPGWIPPTPEQIREQREYLHDLAKKGRPMKPIHVPGPGEFVP